MKPTQYFALLLIGLTCQSTLLAQRVSTAPTAGLQEDEKVEEGLTAEWKTRGRARTLVLSIPAPRGQIVDRGGRPLAQTRVAHFAAIQFPSLGEEPTDAKILEFGRTALRKLNETLGHSEADAWTIPDTDLISHYHNRRWVPLMLDNTLSDDQSSKIQHLMADGVIAYPVYLRHYPRGEVACHIIGYVGKKRPLPQTLIQNGDPLFWEWEGRAGIEASFDKELTGTPGELNVVYDGEGKEMSRDILRRPVAGQTVVLTLDADMQELAEDSMNTSGAFVMCDANNGEILVLASSPQFDPNEFVPGISEERLKQLLNDKMKPLYARAFQGTYPPASSFKIPMSVALLKDERVTPTSRFNCPGSIRIGNMSKGNYGGRGYGVMDIRRAITVSCNTWFYQVGMMVGGDALYREAINFGFGSPTGIPLPVEASGLIPSDSYYRSAHQRKMFQGDVANFVIGQGDVSVTPLQVAQALTGIATGNEIWRARLIKQTQTHSDEVLLTTQPQLVGSLGVSEKFLEPIRNGMIDVVHAGHGTGKQAYVSGVKMAGKTGTGQLRGGSKQMGWFTGYLPADEPQYTFAIAYEGTGSRSITGGGYAAPIAKKFFSKLYGNRDPAKDLYAEVKPPGGERKRVASKDDDSDDEEKAVASNTKSRSSSSSKKRSSRREAAAPQREPEVRKAVPVPEPPPRKRGFLDRLFGR